ncbi:carboxylesterase [Sclerotinia borealis F-4128]|uniref:Carboxylic ester hydrolase n=1 Tax=Sclerotinia borealis (strain F-4128) TaxID=1432307 RepID=W9CRK5_SCLBF|nr:carboxylesterase [Sclerotinia borealis F-4128]
MSPTFRSLGFILFIMWALVSTAVAVVTNNTTTSLPTVDLGYSIHQATLNAPIGSLRFAAPVPPIGRNITINNGQHDSICPQATPAWMLTAEIFVDDYLSGQNVSNFTNPPHEMVARRTALSVDPRSSEDCLFLDVIVPQKIFSATKTSEIVAKNAGNETGAPVLVWIYGGGYATGSKTSTGNPAGLISASLANEKEGVVYVAMNYRLGLFGWLAGDSDVIANAGLLDQRLALEWVQTHIYLFGGDPKRVTVMGESAGGGSILHHITAYGGTKGRTPFQQAIPQSPAFIPIVPSQAKASFHDVIGNASLLSNTTVTTASQLRTLPYEILSGVNTMMIGKSSYGQFTFGPVVDGSYVPDFPPRLLTQGAFDHNIGILVGHNSDEGLLLTNPAVQTQPEFVSTFEQALPSANASVIFHLTNILYPPIYDGSYGYTSPIGRLALSISHLTITCNAYSLASTFSKISPKGFNPSSPSSSYAYLFSVPPGTHGIDVPYTFFNGDTTDSPSGGGPPVIASLATLFQHFLIDFVISGNPSSDGTFERYSKNQTVTDIDITGLTLVKDPASDSRCDYWLRFPYYSE